MSYELVVQRRFLAEDQEQFADLSADRNPMHMDPVFARRTQPGAPVVHGIHVLLWSLESLACAGVDLAALSQLRVRFNKFVYVGRMIAMRVLERDQAQLKLSIEDDGLILVKLSLQLGVRTPTTADAGSTLADQDATQIGQEPSVPSLVEMASLSGWLAPTCDQDSVSTLFPALTAAIGASRVTALIQLSTLVGMVCPGLHSIFSGLSFRLNDELAARPGIGWRTTRMDDRYRMVDMAVAGSGIAGEVSTFVRREPSNVASVDTLSERITANEFHGVRALIIGGSRGLGAATAKLLAAGGAQVVLSYLHGRQEAEAVMADIVRARGHDACCILRYDTAGDAAEQLAALGGFDQLYYFATAQIFRQKAERYSPALFADFIHVYVDGFHAALRGVQALAPGRLLSAFYPSSVAVDERPRGMTEYAMAKAAGELLCASIAQHEPALRVVVGRIPRTATDQTATVAPVAAENPLDVMLPLLRRMKR